MTDVKPVINQPATRIDTSICPHLEAILPTHGSDEVSTDIALRTSVQWGSIKEGAKRRKVASAQCKSCSTPLARPWACLTCPYVGCMSIYPSSPRTSQKTCTRSHWSSSDCGFAIDPMSGAIFCSQCDDLIYSDTFEDLLHSSRIRIEESNDKSREQSMSVSMGRSRGSWKPWIPNEGHIALNGEMARTPCRAILQALIHNPLLKAYFLSDKHNRHICYNNSKGLVIGRPFLGADFSNGGGVGPDREKGCMCCEMDRAFEEFYNDEKSPYGPTTMLYAMWHASAELEGYGQQAALDQIHAHAKGQMSSCNCIAHSTFAGSLTSTVTCSSCHEPSITIDPILDIQLDFPTIPEQPINTEPVTLASLLRRFCAVEKVTSDPGKGYACSKCGGGPGVDATRKLMIKKLPPVLSFQLKRFAHNSTSTKIESPIKFPSSLDMRPYTQHSESEFENNSESSLPLHLPSSLYLYDLFAVVTHEGKLDNGHYWADVLSQGEWWHCDDDKVTPTTLSTVLSQKAYMLFYVKRSLAYVQPMSKLLANGSSISSSANGNGNGNGIQTLSSIKSQSQISSNGVGSGE